MIAEEIQYQIQHHVGLKLPYLGILMAVQGSITLPEEAMTMEEFIDNIIIAMHEGRRNKIA